MDDFTELEKQLKTLKPKDLSPETKEQIGGRLLSDGKPGTKKYRTAYWLKFSSAAAAGLIIVIGLFILLDIPGREKPVTPEPFLPAAENTSIEITETWSQIFDEGAVMLNNTVPARKLRRKIMEQVKWHDPDRNVTVEIAVPHEEIIFIQKDLY